MKIESFKHDVQNNRIEGVKREESNTIQPTNPPKRTPDKVWKEIYAVIEGKIILLDTIEGNHAPGYYVEEEIVFLGGSIADN